MVRAVLFGCGNVHSYKVASALILKTISSMDPKQILERINILVADDMDAILSVIKACLANLGAQKVNTATNGKEAWKILQHQHIHLIVSDWDMPQMTGFELLKKVRSSDDHRHIPFLLLTATNDRNKVLSAKKAGVDEYVAKPFKSKELEYRVVKLLGRVKLN
jgi:two-component system chemotaxis response regulator CheY